MSSVANIPRPHNEPVLSYAPGTTERDALKRALTGVGGERPEIPAVVGGREVRSGKTQNVVSPHCHARVLATLHEADQATIDAAVASAVEAQREWGHWRFEDRAAVFLRAADLLATRHRQRLNAATMLGQSKTAFQAEIDSACELIDFLRFNVHYAERIYQEQPDSAPGVWNRMDHRPLEGFVYAITPFNFTAIGGNLPTAPALMGNTVIWKPSHTAVLSNWHFYQLLVEAGLPPGVINFVPGDAVAVSRTLLAHPEFAGIHFTGSTTVFRSLWKTIGDNLGRYRSYPRIVGETGGKDFILAHPSADVDATEVQRGLPCVHPRHPVARGARPGGGNDWGHSHGRCRRFPELHGRRDRPARLHPHPRAPRGRRVRAGRQGHRGRWRGRQRWLLRAADSAPG
jgi:1-pyrroline-5-carboxylate dehydrogenase